MKVALATYAPSIPTGLGTLAAALWKLLPFEVGLFARHKDFECPLPPTGGSREALEVGMQGPDHLAMALRGLGVEAVVAAERVIPESLFEAAKSIGARTVLIVMHEWFNANCPWLAHTDIFVVPNAIAERKLLDMGLAKAKVKRLNLPLDLEALPFRRREAVSTLIYSNGWGGVHDRKGWPEMQAALDLLLEEEQRCVRINTQRRLPPMPQRLNVRIHADGPADIYAKADAALVPSRLEGFGYGLLEPMALGLPVLATNAEPMSEIVRAAYGEDAAFCLLPVAKVESKLVWNKPVVYAICLPSGIADGIRRALRWSPAFCQKLSEAGRKYVDANHGTSACSALWEAVCG